MRRAFGVLAVAGVVAVCLAARSGDVITDDFTKQVPGRWKLGSGGRYTISGGELRIFPKKGVWQKTCVVCDLPLKEGVVEAEARTMHKSRSASAGIVGKLINEQKYWAVRLAYGGITFITRGTQTPWSCIGGLKIQDGRTHKLKLVIRDGRAGFFLDGVLRGIFKDPFAGQAGRPGVFSESSSVATSFTARRTK